MANSEPIGRAITLHDNDNVATALEDLVQGSIIVVMGSNLSILLQNDISFGHKFALRDLQAGDIIVKYGVPIGVLTHSVSIGSHVHTHNLVTLQRKGATTA